MVNVSIVQEFIPNYRVAFYQHLKKRFDENGIRLDLFYGAAQTEKSIAASVPWALAVNTRRVGRLTWQDVVRNCQQSSLVIVPQQVRYPAPIFMQLTRCLGSRKHAFWGHGKNLKAESSQFASEWLKRFLSTRVDWWFAYNDFSARLVEEMGYPKDRITSVMNAIDTSGIRRRHEMLTSEEVTAARNELGIESDNVAVYTGSLRDFKRPEFLIASCGKIRELIPDFHMIVIGDGPDAPMIEKAAQKWPWFHYLGRKDDMEKVPYWALSKLLLMPGGVGLVVLDSFALGIPMVTTENRFHGPEIDYLKDGINGMMVKPGDNPSHYAAEVASLLRDHDRREKMAAAALSDRDIYSSEDMSVRFAQGVMEALEKSRYRVWF
jgi:glycosyltransferase involved in cell wall biosynthesis